MTRIYRDILNSFSEGIFKSIRIVFHAISTLIKPFGDIIYYQANSKQTTEKQAIRSDFSKIGKDLFGALNDYERKQATNLSNK